jgi:hypothetical protein
MLSLGFAFEAVRSSPTLKQCVELVVAMLLQHGHHTVLQKLQVSTQHSPGIGNC